MRCSRGLSRLSSIKDRDKYPGDYPGKWLDELVQELMCACGRATALGLSTSTPNSATLPHSSFIVIVIISIIILWNSLATESRDLLRYLWNLLYHSDSVRHMVHAYNYS